MTPDDWTAGAEAQALKIICVGCALDFPTENNPEEGILHRADLRGMDELFHCIAAAPDDEEIATAHRVASALTAAHAAGAEAMREAVAKTLCSACRGDWKHLMPVPYADSEGIYFHRHAKIVDATGAHCGASGVRALPIPPRPSGGGTDCACKSRFTRHSPGACWFTTKPGSAYKILPLGVWEPDVHGKTPEEIAKQIADREREYPTPDEPSGGKPQEPQGKAKDRLLEMAWGVIANVSEGDWIKQPVTWQEAAARWRDDWLALIGDGKPLEPAAPPPDAGQEPLGHAFVECGHDFRFCPCPPGDYCHDLTNSGRCGRPRSAHVDGGTK